jgi:hypothetical protein
MRQRITLSDQDLKDAVRKWLELKFDKDYDPAQWEILLGARSVSFQPGESDLHWVAEVTAERDPDRKRTL